MTTISTIASIVLTPLLISNLSGNIIDVDAMGFFYSTLKVILIPILLGVFINNKFPNYTESIKFTPSFAVILITLIVASIIGQGSRLFLAQDYHYCLPS